MVVHHSSVGGNDPTQLHSAYDKPLWTIWMVCGRSGPLRRFDPTMQALARTRESFFLAGCLYVGAGLATLPTSLRKKNRHQPASRDRRKLAGAVFSVV